MTARDLVIRTLTVALTILLIVALARLLTRITDILILILISVILAAGLNPLVTALQRWVRLGRGRRRRPISKPGAILLIYAAFALLLILVGSAIITPLVAETREFVVNLPQFLENLEGYLRGLEARYSWLPDLSAIIGRLPSQVARLTTHLGTAAGVALGFLGGVASLLTVLFMTFYMLVEGPEMKRQFLTLFPPDQQARIEDTLRHIGQKFGGWVRGQLLLGLIIGVAAGLGTWALGLPYPFLLGLIAGFTELIPIVGPVLGAIPAVLIALFQPPWWRIVAVVVLYGVIQQAEANFVVPRVMRAAVGISPLLTVIALLIGAKLLGIAGALLSVPVAAALQVVVGEILQTVRTSQARPGTREPATP